MNIEIVEFYLAKERSGRLAGTLHIYLCDLGIDIRGCPVIRSAKGKWIFLLPSKKSFDHDIQTEISYPIIEFTDMAKKEEVLEFLRKNGPRFVEERLKGCPKRANPAKPSTGGRKKPFKSSENKIKKGELTYTATNR